MADEPQYSYLAARLLSNYMAKEVSNQNIWSFSQSIERGYELGIVNDTLRDFVTENARKLNQSIRNDRNNLFHYFRIAHGLRSLPRQAPKEPSRHRDPTVLLHASRLCRF